MGSRNMIHMLGISFPAEVNIWLLALKFDCLLDFNNQGAKTECIDIH